MDTVENRPVVVVGGGLAGVACTAILAARGHQPLLLCETAEVGRALKSPELDGCRGVTQLPMWLPAWNGGYFLRLARELDFPLRFRPVPTGSLKVRGRDDRVELSASAAAATIVDMLGELSPIPIDEELKGELHRLFRLALALDPAVVVRMHELSVAEWLEKEAASIAAMYFMSVLSSMMTEFPVETAASRLSVSGALATIRGSLCGDGVFVSIDPDTRDGFAVPMARRAEELGATIWRRVGVARVSVEDGAVRGVTMRNGREIRCDIAVLAVTNPRVGAILDPVPPEVEDVLAFPSSLVLHEMSTYTLFDEPFIGDRSWVTMIDADGSNLIGIVPIHAVAPWATDGRQMVLAQCLRSPEHVAKLGGAAGVEAHMHDLCEELYPGWKAAMSTTTMLSHAHLWHAGMCTDPKLPRRSTSVRGLWFMGDGSLPVGGVGVEAAAGCGYEGATELADLLDAAAIA